MVYLVVGSCAVSIEKDHALLHRFLKNVVMEHRPWRFMKSLRFSLLPFLL
jgi:hypothetical protein